MLTALLTLGCLLASAPEPSGPGPAARAPAARWEPARTWSLVVGVIHWKDKDLADFSSYHRKDKELDQALGARGVPATQRVLLTDRAATAGAVLGALGRQLLAAPRGSTFVFYFSGHGARDSQGGLVLTTSDAVGEKLDTTGLHAAALAPLFLMRGSEDRVLLLSDACTSGDLSAVALAVSMLGVPTASLTSAAAQSESTGNWTYSQVLIDALRGHPLLDADGDGAITLGEVAAEEREALKYREGQPMGFMPAGLPLGFELAETAAWPEAIAALDPGGDHYRRGDWVLARGPDGARGVGRVLGAERKATSGKRAKAVPRLRLAFYGFADETLGWAREDRVEPVFFLTWPVGSRLEVVDDDETFQAEVLAVSDDLHFIHYVDYGPDEDEWVTPDQILGPWQPDPDDPRAVRVNGRDAWVKGERDGRTCVTFPGELWSEDLCVAPDRVKHRHPHGHAAGDP